MKLGILDFGEVYNGTNSIEVIHSTISNCQLADQKGFSRFWLAEHYANSVAWRNTDIMITLLAGYTEKIKIGSAGVKIDVNQSSFHIAQNYRTLATLFENRIDLGIAKGSETEEVMDVILDTEFIINREHRVKKILNLFDDGYESISLVPQIKINPDVWMLSTSSSMHSFCIENKLNLSISLFHKLTGELPSKDILNRFKDEFYIKNGYLPEVNIAVSVFCNNSKIRIEREIESRENVAINVIGNPEECQEKIYNILKEYDVDEAILMNLGRDHEEKAFLIENILN